MQGILNSFGGQECYKILKNVLPVPSEALLVKHSLSRHFFPADITKTLTAKRKRIQTFTQASLKASSRKFDEVWRTQQRERWEKRNLFFLLDTVKVEDRLGLKDLELNIRWFTWSAFRHNIKWALHYWQLLLILSTRSSHYDEFSKQLMNVITQGETDLQKTREAEEKLEVTETREKLLQLI